MVGSVRGIARRSKRKPEPDPPSSDQAIEELESKALAYLKAELDLYLQSPGNYTQVGRVLSILQSLRRPSQAEHNPSDPNRDRFRFDSLEQEVGPEDS